MTAHDQDMPAKHQKRPTCPSYETLEELMEDTNFINDAGDYYDTLLNNDLGWLEMKYEFIKNY